MPFTSPFNYFMAKKKPRGSTPDELAVIKAAAWAWYQHGSGSERKPIGELDIRRTQRVPKPSRYKLEAMRSIEEDHDHATEGCRSTDSPIHTDNNSLLDTYEIESISKRIDNLIIEESSNRIYNKILVRNHDDDDFSKGSTNSDIEKRKAKKGRRFWPLRHAILCGTRKDVAASQPEKRATVVKLGSRRPRVSHA